MKPRGFTLVEMLVALAIAAILLLGASRFLPLLTAANLRQLMHAQLVDELAQMAFALEKAIRRAGYCHGSCLGQALRLNGGDRGCLLLRWDGNSNGRWEGPAAAESDGYGYRLRNGNLEAQRGVTDCQGAGWEKLNDPRTVRITAFRLQQQGQRVQFTLEAQAQRWPALREQVSRWVNRENHDATTTGRQRAGDGGDDFAGR